MSQIPIKSPQIAIIGSGLAGLTCATALQGFADVQVFEKSFFCGGRLSRYQFGEYSSNYGEQWFTISNPLFLKLVNAWQASGIVRPLDGWVVELDKGQVLNLDDNTRRFTGYPYMHVITDNLARNCQLKLSTSIVEIEKMDTGQWRLFDDRGAYQGIYDIVIMATAAHQLGSISGIVDSISSVVEKIDMTVCWEAMFAFEKPLNLPFDAAFVLDSPLSWASRFRKAGAENDAPECWVVHSSHEWSLQYVTSFRGRVMHALQNAFFEACDIAPVKLVTSKTHLWKHALPINTLGEDCLFDENAALGACGDWCTAPRIEGAVLSGFSMADRIMKFIK